MGDMVGQDKPGNQAQKSLAKRKERPLEVERCKLDRALDRLDLCLQALEEEIEQAKRELEGLIPTARIHSSRRSAF